MKKIFVPLFAFVLLLLPLKAFAAVDITLEDKSIAEQKSVSVLVDTGTDVTDTVAFQIQASTDVKVSSVVDQNSICSNFTYTNVSNLINFTCTLSEPTPVNGYVATILFTSTSSDYTFTLSQTQGLDLGNLTLGTVVNIGSQIVTASPETTKTLDTTAQANTANTTKTSFQTAIADYLPYILIGGAVILLISILGILFSKKKEHKPEEEVTNLEEKPVQETPLDNPPTNIENISESLYTPEVSQPTIQESLEAKPIEQAPVVDIPQEPSAPVESSQSNDLADLINNETQPTPAPQEVTQEPIQEMTSTPEVTQAPAPITDLPYMQGMTDAPTETTPVLPMVEEPLPTQTAPELPDLQNMINQVPMDELGQAPVAPVQDDTVPPVLPTM